MQKVDTTGCYRAAAATTRHSALVFMRFKSSMLILFADKAFGVPISRLFLAAYFCTSDSAMLRAD